MAERVQQPLAPVATEEDRQPDERVPAGPDLAKFRQLVLQAQEAKGLAQGQLATRVNDALIAMRKPGNDHAEATEVLFQLSLETLGHLTDVHGRNCRKEAVETLMAMGFSHALKITPDDFEFAQRYTRRQAARAAARRVDEADEEANEEEHEQDDGWRRKMLQTRYACAALVVFGNVISLAMLAMGATSSGLTFGAIAAGLNVAAALYLVTRELTPEAQTMPITALVLTGVLNLVAALVTGSGGPAIALFTCMMGIVVAMNWQNTEPRRRW